MRDESDASSGIVCAIRHSSFVIRHSPCASSRRDMPRGSPRGWRRRPRSSRPSRPRCRSRRSGAHRSVERDARRPRPAGEPRALPEILPLALPDPEVEHEVPDRARPADRRDRRPARAQRAAPAARSSGRSAIGRRPAPSRRRTAAPRCANSRTLATSASSIAPASPAIVLRAYASMMRSSPNSSPVALRASEMPSLNTTTWSPGSSVSTPSSYGSTSKRPERRAADVEPPDALAAERRPADCVRRCRTRAGRSASSTA